MGRLALRVITLALPAHSYAPLGENKKKQRITFKACIMTKESAANSGYANPPPPVHGACFLRLTAERGGGGGQGVKTADRRSREKLS